MPQIVRGIKFFDFVCTREFGRRGETIVAMKSVARRFRMLAFLKSAAEFVHRVVKIRE